MQQICKLGNLDVICTEDTVDGMKTFAAVDHPTYKLTVVGRENSILGFGVVMINDLIIYQGDVVVANGIFNDYYVTVKETCSLIEELQKEIYNLDGLNLSTEINQDEDTMDMVLTSVISFGEDNSNKLYVSLFNGNVRSVFKKSGEVRVVPRSEFNSSDIIDEFIMSI